MKGASTAGRRTRSSTPALSPPMRRSSFNVSSDQQSTGSLRRIFFKDLDDSNPPANSASSTSLHVNDALCRIRQQRRSSLPVSSPHRTSSLISGNNFLGRVHTPAGNEAAADTLGGVHTSAGNRAAVGSTSSIQSNRLSGHIHVPTGKSSTDAAADRLLGCVHTSSGKCCNGVAVNSTSAIQGNRSLGRVHAPSSGDAAICATADLVRRTKGDALDNGHPFGVQQQRRFSSPAALPSSRAYADASSSSSTSSFSSSSSLLYKYSSRSSTSKSPSAVCSMLAPEFSVQKSDCSPSFRRFNIDNVVVTDSSPSTSSYAAKSTNPFNSSADEPLETRLHRMTLRSDTARAAGTQYYGDDDIIVKGKTTRKSYKDYDDDDDDYNEDSIDVDDDDASCLANKWHEADTLHPIGSGCLVGLHNEGNTCYLNSCVQCLVHTMPLATAMLSGQANAYTDKGSKERTLRSRSPRRASSSLLDNTDRLVSSRRSADANRLAMEFENLLKDMWSSSRLSYSVTSATSFLKSLQSWEPQFSGYQQQDAQEAMRAILDGLHESLNRVRNRKYKDVYREHGMKPEEELADIMWDYHRSLNDSIIQDIFCGQLQSSVECSVCKTTSLCFDPFLDLSLPLPKNGTLLFGGRKKGSPINKCRVSIQDCLALFVAPEALSGRDTYTCATCKVPQISMKKLSIFRIPTILVLHLKRFQGSGGLSYEKDDTPVSYPLRGLDLTQFLAKSSQKKYPNGVLYDLYGVCYHSGTIGFGHYTAQCKNEDELWYSFNDSLVSPSQESTIVSSSAYILFYQLRHA